MNVSSLYVLYLMAFLFKIKGLIKQISRREIII
jgi:hypothetical protein